jgi:hypothetical protein
MYYIQDRNDDLDTGVSEASIYPTEMSTSNYWIIFLLLLQFD